jgi:hypothetical protein
MATRRTTARPQSALQPRKPLPVRAPPRSSRPVPPPAIKDLTAEELRDRFQIKETKLSELRREKSVALSAKRFDLDRADAIQRLIDLNRRDTTCATFEEYCNWLRDGILPALSTMDSQLAEVADEMDELEFTHRAEIDELFEFMKEDHIAQLAKIEFDRTVETLLEEGRVSGARRRLTKVARTLGATDDMEMARRVMREEETVKISEEKNTSEQLQKKFDTLRDQKLAEHLQAIERLQENFNARLDEKDRLKAEKQAAVVQRAAVYVKFELRRAIAGASEHLPVAARKNATAKLTRFVMDLLAENDKEFLLE